MNTLSSQQQNLIGGGIDMPLPAVYTQQVADTQRLFQQLLELLNQESNGGIPRNRNN